MDKRKNTMELVSKNKKASNKIFIFNDIELFIQSSTNTVHKKSI